LYDAIQISARSDTQNGILGKDRNKRMYHCGLQNRATNQVTLLHSSRKSDWYKVYSVRPEWGSVYLPVKLDTDIASTMMNALTCDLGDVGVTAVTGSIALIVALTNGEKTLHSHRNPQLLE
jgi:hypothetical protein